MKKILCTLVAILATTFSVATAANTTPAENAAHQFAFYIGHNDAVKAELMVSNPELLPAYMSSMLSEINAHGGFKTAKVVSSETHQSQTSVTIAFVCKEGEFTIEQTFVLTRNEAQEWQVMLK